MYQHAMGILGIGIYCALFVLNVNSQNTDKPRFSCEGRPSGYYADVHSGCQIYHMCDGLGRQFSYSCPNTTLFQQRMLICDHWYMVNCSKSEVDYSANLLIGQRGKPFVEDDVENPYHRTPRPDLLAHPSAAEYNIIYRTGRAQLGNNKNLVGADLDSEESSGKLTDQPAYFLPSHWSTEYYKSSTDRAEAAQKNKPKQKVDIKKPFFPIKSEETYKNDDLPLVNFKSNFKATTPVYPKIAPTELPLLEEDFPPNNLRTIIQPPRSNERRTNTKEQVKVNFESNYKATTPVYPKFVSPEIPLASQERKQVNDGVYGISTIIEPPTDGKKVLNIQQPNPSAPIINFKSNFKATTPVYPTFVSSSEPFAFEETAIDPNKPNPSTVIQPPKSFKENDINTFQEPSVYYQPPFTKQQATTRPSRLQEIDKKWTELRRLFLIPEYDFPLDSVAGRPKYDHGPSSFQVNPFSHHVMPREHA